MASIDTPEGSIEMDNLMTKKDNVKMENRDTHEKLEKTKNGYASYTTTTKLSITVAMLLACSSMGIYAEIVGPTIPDLKDRVNANYEQIARTLVARSVGYCFGALIGGTLAHSYPIHLEVIIFLSSLFGAVGSAVVPWCTDLWQLALMLHIEGWGQGFINIGTDTLCLAMWGKRAASPIHALHFGFGVGALLAPQLVKSFIAERQTQAMNNSTNLVTTTNYATTSDYLTVEPKNEELPGLQSSIEIPYTISAIYSLLFFIVFLFFYINGRSMRKRFNREKLLQNNNSLLNSTKKILKSLSPGSCTGGNIVYGSMFFILLFLYYANVVGGERAYGRFIFSYAVNSGFSSGDAAILNSIFWIGFTSGRGISALLAYWCRPTILLIIELSMNIVTGVALSVWGLTVPGVLWVFTGILGMFLSPIFPGGVAWSNLYVEMKGLAITILYIGASIGAIVYQWLTGYLFEYVGPPTLMYVILGYALGISLVFFLMNLVVKPHGQRFK